MLSEYDTSDIMWNSRDEVAFTNTLLLIDSPKTMILICIFYLTFVLKLGPQLMRRRPPYQLNTLMVLYNALQVCFSGLVVYRSIPVLWQFGLKPSCFYTRETMIHFLTTTHFYFLFKVIELLDTVIFILRKKFSQASFLHVYHHTYVVLLVWTTMRFHPSYATLFPGALNSFVHVVMYTYYSFSTFPKMAKYLWWKKYITTLQLVQFVIIIWHMLRSYHTSECPPSFMLAYGMFGNCLLFIILFLNFYFKTYSNPGEKGDACGNNSK